MTHDFINRYFSEQLKMILDNWKVMFFFKYFYFRIVLLIKHMFGAFNTCVVFKWCTLVLDISIKWTLLSLHMLCTRKLKVVNSSYVPLRNRKGYFVGVLFVFILQLFHYEMKLHCTFSYMLLIAIAIPTESFKS